jgi:hypothetical protein
MKRKTPKFASSMKHAAALLKVSAALVKLGKRRCPEAFDSHNRVNLAVLRKWIGTNAGKTAVTEIEKLELRKLRAQCEKIEQLNAVQQSKFIKTEDVIRMIQELANAQRTILRQKLENEYPPIVAGMDPAQVRVYSKRLVDEIFRLFQELKTVIKL